MSRTLRFDYTFVPASNQVQISGNVSGKRLLLIHNATAGIVIYNIGDNTLKANSITYNASTNLTTITLNYNCSSMSASDTLQIFTEQDSTSFIPDESLIDGVGKHKVSEPETLIDTDFEYGLQGVKWETLQRINNIPSAYSVSGNVPLNNVIDVQANGTTTVTVVCSSAHNLAAGTPIDIRGLTSSSAEGTYIVRRVTTNTFSYVAPAVQGASVGSITSLFTASTFVVSGGFYAQSFIPLDSNNLTSGTITTDANPVSSLTVRTPYPHGFNSGSNFYLTNTLSNRSVSFNPQTITNANGNVEDRTTVSLSTGNFNPFEPIHAGTTLRIVDAASSISTANGTITIPNHGLVTGDAIAYLGSSGTEPVFAVSSPTFGVTAGNLLKYGTSTGSFLYAAVIDPDTFRLASGPQDAYNGNALFTFSNAGTGNLHFSLFNKRGNDISSNIGTIVTTSGISNITVNLTGNATNRSLGIYPKMQMTLDGALPNLNPTVAASVRGVGVYVVSASGWTEGGTSFQLTGPTDTNGALINQTATVTYNISYTGASTNTLLRAKSLESTLNPTISTASGAVVTFSSNFTNLGNGDSPVRVGSHVRFTNVGSLTGVSLNTDYFVSAFTSNSITLSSTSPSVSVTPITIGGTVGAATLKIFSFGLRAQLHTSPWINHTRASIHDWVSITAKSFTKEAVVGNQIYIKNHGLETAEPVLYVGGGNTWSTGPTDATLYFISPVNRDQIQLWTAENVTGSGPYSTAVSGSQVTFGTVNTSASTAAGGVYQIHPGFTVNTFTAATGGAGGGRDRAIAQFTTLPSYMTELAPIVFTQGSGSTLPTPLTNTPNTYSAYQKYFARTLITPGYGGSNQAEFSVSIVQSGTHINFTGSTTSGAGRFFCARIIENPFSNSFFLPNHGGFSSTGSTATQRTTYVGTTDTAGTYPAAAGFPGPLFDYTTDTTGIQWPRVYATLTQSTPIGGLANSTAYYMVPVTNDIWKVQNFNASNIPTGHPTVQFTSLAGATNAMSFSNTSVPHPGSNRIIVPVESQVLTENAVVRYQSQGNIDLGSAFANAPGLVNDSSYVARNVVNFYPLSVGVNTTVDLDATSTVLTLNAASSTYMSIVSGNTLYTGNYLQEQMLVTAVSGNTVTVVRGYNGTTATFIPSGTNIFKVHGTFQLSAREITTPRAFSVAFNAGNTADSVANGSSATNGNAFAYGATHYFRTGDPIVISALPTSGAGTNTLTGAALGTGILYYVIPLTSTTFQLAHSKAAAFAGYPIRITNVGTAGSWSFTQFFDSIPLAGTASSSGNHSFIDVSSTGTLDGSYTASSVTASGIVLSTGVNIPNRVFTFNPANVVNLRSGEFYIQNHGLTTGTPVTYSTNGNLYAIGFSTTGASPRPGYNSLTNGTTYFVIRRGVNSIQLAATKADSLAGNAIQNFSYSGTVSTGSNPGHTLTTSQVAGEVLGNGLATVVTRDALVDGSSTAVVLAGSSRIVATSHGFSTGDRVIYQVWGNGTAINGLVNGNQYFINNTVNTTTSRGGAATGQSANQFSLHTSWVGAYTNTDLVLLSGVGIGRLHQFKVTNPTMQGTVFKGDWNSADSYFYGDVVLFRNNYYMSVSGTTTGTANTNQQPASDAGVYNYNWMLLPALPSYSTRWQSQYRPGDTIKLSNQIVSRTLWFNGSSGSVVNTTTSVLTLNNHGLSTGDAVIYKLDVQGGNYNGTNGGYTEYTTGTIPQTAIGGLTANQIYYVNVIDANNFTLATSPSASFVGGSTSTGEFVQLTAVGTGQYHRLEKIESFVNTMNILAIPNDSQMVVNDPYPSRQLIINPQTTTNLVSGLISPNVSLERDEFYFQSHGLQTGTKILYSCGFGIGSAIGGLTDSTAYYVIRINDDVFKLATTLSNALTLQAIDITSTGSGFYHYFVATSIPGSSYIRYTNAQVLGADTGFAGTAFYTGQNSSNIAVGVLHALPILTDTRVYTNPNSLVIHRPFDGGIETAVGQSPNCSVVRQTKKYFRYQAGKGFSYSTGINFSPPLDIASIRHDGTTFATVTTRRPHKLSAGSQIKVDSVVASTGSSAPYTNPSNGQFFTVNNVIDDFNFRYATNGVPTDLNPGGFPRVFLYTWSGANVRAGMFDDQNGAFLEYDGSQLWAVRRSSTQQLAGTVSATYLSNTIVGTNTVFTKQLAVGNNIVIRGMSYVVTSIPSDTLLTVSAPYRGNTGTNITATITIDTRTPASSFSADKLDGTGRSGYIFDPNRIQMIYITWSWYGAGKIKYGMLDQKGNIFYFHEYIHNNERTRAYMRAGNLPARYEVTTGNSPTYYPTLFHWGVSVIMDGKFENDFNYLFTAASGSAGSDTITIPSGLAGTLVPILSLRLAPSVTSSLVGNLGDRDLINRMKISLNSVGIVVNNANNRPCSVRLVLNPSLTQSAYFTNQGAPSLSQIIKHTGQSTDLISGGTNIFEFRAAVNTSVVQDISGLTELGNSIQGGNYNFPDGPDILTLAVVPTDTAANTSITARISWTESQS